MTDSFSFAGSFAVSFARAAASFSGSADDGTNWTCGYANCTLGSAMNDSRTRFTRRVRHEPFAKTGQQYTSVRSIDDAPTLQPTRGSPATYSARSENCYFNPR